ncbi:MULTISPECIES: DUF1653 domain-containing protein [Bacillus]|uniref:DUF1653 domain-containing protein n=1 Tax=Bacillus TaxID=1386 RepID=UPI001BFFE436|nr:DUF1653 domain-containing protein [Bacillus velezensis]
MDTFDFIGCHFKHYKGGLYKVIREVIHTETEESWLHMKTMTEFFGKVVVESKEIHKNRLGADEIR